MATKILHVRLPCKKIYPAGTVYLADFIHKNLPLVEQKILDLAILNKKDRKKALEKTIEDIKPDIVAFSWRDIQIFSPDQRDPSLETVFKFYYSGVFDKISASFKGLKLILFYKSLITENLSYINWVVKNFDRQVVIGGPAFSVFPNYIINKVGEGAIGIIGEGEETLLKIAKNQDFSNERVVYKKQNKIIWGKKERYLNLSASKAISFDYISEIFPEFKQYLNDYVGIQTKRGCPQECIFCLYNYIEGKDIRYRKPAEIAKEIQILRENFGVKKIWLTDSQFIPSKSSVDVCEETLDEILKTKAEIEWTSYVRIENITKSLAEKMIKSGIKQFELSITSGSQEIINKLKLGFNLNDIFSACEKIKNSGFESQNIILNYSLNSPGESKATLKQSIETFKKISKIFGKNVYPFIFFLAIQPHTELEKYTIETGYLPPNYNMLSINPFSVKKLIYNPPPLDRLMAESCLNAWENCEKNEEFGEYVINYISKKI